MQDIGTDRPAVQDIPIGLSVTGTRREFASMGQWTCRRTATGVPRRRALCAIFSIGGDRMPKEVYHAYGYMKKACALVNETAGRLPVWKAAALVRAAYETIAGKLDEHFPLYVWQTGSGTQSNMTVNEVNSNRAIQLVGSELGSQHPIGPDDDVNMGRPSNDSFPTAMRSKSGKSGKISAEQYERIIVPRNMIGEGIASA
jgi:fumarate hydratase, class II